MTWSKPLEPGDAAPGFVLPTIDRDGTVGLDDYRGRCAVMVGFFRGLFCPFCRRQIAQLGACTEKLRQAGTETLGVLITPVGRGRLYFRYHPARMPLAADESATTHQAFGVPRFEVIPDTEASRAIWPYAVTETEASSMRVNPGGIFPEPVHPDEAGELLNRADGFEWTDDDTRVMKRHSTQLDGLFLIDRDGVVRWRHLEGVDDSVDFGTFPSEETLIAAVSALGR